MQVYQFFLLLGLICWGFGLFQLFQSYDYYQKFKASQGWPETHATVTERKINQRVPPPTRRVPFWVEIKYFYTVFGTKINGFMVKRPRLFSTDELVNIFKEFPEGSTFLIRYNPEKPTMHITEYDKFIFNWGRVIIAFVWGAIIIFGISATSH